MKRSPQAPEISAQQMKKMKEPDLVKCVACACTWFEQIQAVQVDKFHTVIIGQEVPHKSPVPFQLLRCIRCGELHEPNISAGPQDVAKSKYDEFLDDMETDQGPTGEPV